MGASRYFVRYILLGLSLQIVAITTLKWIGLASAGMRDSAVHSIGLALGILAISLITLFGYIYAVKKDPELLAEDSAPDLAYYLGFALTVGALAISFIVDLFLVRWDPSIRADLVQGSLGQFGAGLVATVLGLAGKIHLNSLQDNLGSEPEVLYRDLRESVRVLSHELRDSVDSLRIAFSESSAELARGTEESTSALMRLTTTIVEAKSTIEETLSRGNIEAPVKRFISELDSLTDTVATMKGKVAPIAAVATETRDSLSGLNDSATRLSTVLVSSTSSLDSLVVSIQSTGEQSKALSSSLKELERLVSSVAELNAALYNATHKLVDSSEKYGAVLEESLPSAKEFQLSAGQLATEITALAARVASIDTSVQSIVKSSQDAEQAITKLSSANDILSTQTSRVSAELSSMGTTLTAIKADMVAASTGMREVATSAPQLATATTEAKAQLSELGSSASEVSRSLKTLDDNAQTAGGWITGVASRLMGRTR